MMGKLDQNQIHFESNQTKTIERNQIGTKSDRNQTIEANFP
jgi:hypothetical protein